MAMASVEEEEGDVPEHERSESNDDDGSSQRSSTKPVTYDNMAVDAIIQEDP